MEKVINLDFKSDNGKHQFTQLILKSVNHCDDCREYYAKTLTLNNFLKFKKIINEEHYNMLVEARNSFLSMIEDFDSIIQDILGADESDKIH